MKPRLLTGSAPTVVVLLLAWGCSPPDAPEPRLEVRSARPPGRPFGTVADRAVSVVAGTGEAASTGDGAPPWRRRSSSPDPSPSTIRGTSTSPKGCESGRSRPTGRSPPSLATERVASAPKGHRVSREEMAALHAGPRWRYLSTLPSLRMEAFTS